MQRLSGLFKWVNLRIFHHFLLKCIFPQLETDKRNSVIFLFDKIIFFENFVYSILSTNPGKLQYLTCETNCEQSNFVGSSLLSRCYQTWGFWVPSRRFGTTHSFLLHHFWHTLIKDILREFQYFLSATFFRKMHLP